MEETALYAPPSTVSLGEALHLIFTHYCSPWKSSFADNQDLEQQQQTMDGTSFSRMCREAPELDQYIGRTEIDLIFSKAKPPGIRRLNFDNFLDALLALATRIYPEENPTIALANFLARFIFALFDQPPSPDGIAVIDKILNDLSYEDDNNNNNNYNNPGMMTLPDSPNGMMSGISHSPDTMLQYQQATPSAEYSGDYYDPNM